jgi:hypothetical protein
VPILSEPVVIPSTTLWLSTHSQRPVLPVGACIHAVLTLPGRLLPPHLPPLSTSHSSSGLQSGGVPSVNCPPRVLSCSWSHRSTPTHLYWGKLFCAPRVSWPHPPCLAGGPDPRTPSPWTLLANQLELRKQHIHRSHYCSKNWYM